jgi:hypothetical protein
MTRANARPSKRSSKLSGAIAIRALLKALRLHYEHVFAFPCAALTACILWITLGTPALADEYYDKFGIHASDITAYKGLSIPSCQAGLHDDPDPLKPSGNAAQLRHFAHLFGACHIALQQRRATIGIRRFNDLLLGMTCMALGAVDTDDPVDPMCNLESSLPHQ